jgi:hypothetical protein
MHLPGLTLLFLIFLGATCNKAPADLDTSPFKAEPASVLLTPPLLEVSGIADSRENPGFLWVQEDSGNPSRISLVSHGGEVVKHVALAGIINRDWEDLTLQGNFLFLAETGDNSAVYLESAIYRFREPARAVDTIHSISKIRFTYEDGPRDVEAILVDEQQAIYLLTKREAKTSIYVLRAPYSETALNRAVKVGELTYTGVVGADLSADGKEILVKTYGAIYYYRRAGGQSVEAALNGAVISLPYVAEPQGEAIGFKEDGSGFFTLSERGPSASEPVRLRYYEKK